MPQPFPRAESRALKMFNGLTKSVQVARRLDGRINNLRLFDRPGGQWGPSEVEWQDHPDTEVLLTRRDRLLAIRDEIRACDQILKGAGDLFTPEEKLEAVKSIASLRRQEEAELTAISDKLDSLRGHQARHWQTVGKMVTDLAKLKQTDAHFSARLAFDKQEADGLSAAERAVIEAVPHKEDE